MSPRPFQPIAITGLSALYPQARNLDEFWRLILSGRDCMQDVPSTHWLIEDYYDPTPRAPVKTYAKKGAFLKEVPFDPMAYGLPPSSLPATDIAQVLALILARAVLEDASGGQIAKLKLDQTSIILGVASATELISSMSGLLTRPMWIEGMRRAGIPEPQVQEAAKQITALFPQWTENTFPGCLGNVVAGRVANRFNLGGTNCVTDAACASSLAALHTGINELQLGTSDRVISGGVDALNSIFMFMCFSQTPAMSASGRCSPFAQAADGTMMGEGGGMLCLRRLEDAEREGDSIHAVIRGLGSSSDGRAKSVYAPRPEGQAVALQRCYEMAGYSPATVGLVEAHGTGTAAGDACEAAALKEVFSAAAAAGRRWCALGSVKSQIGHTKGAAGAAGLIKAALALRHRVLPPTANVDAPNPALGLDDSPFYLSTRPRPWIMPEGQARRAGVSSFGFGGTNFHVALEEYRGPNLAPRVRAFGAEVLLASGASVPAVLAAIKAWAQVTDATFAATARETQTGFDPAASVRVAIVAATSEELAGKAAKLAATLQGGVHEVAGSEGVFASASAPRSGDIAYLFPGQGSQSVGMGLEVPMQFSAAMLAWEKLEALTPPGASRVSEVVYPPPALTPADAEAQEQNLRRTDHAQPALGAVSLAYLAVMEAAGLKPDFAGGHSFGEIPALYAAGVIGWEDCVRISRQRGELMARVSAAAPGAMTAVSHRAEETMAIASEFPGCVVANHNSPNQVVIAGPVSAVSALEAALTARQITFRRLPVATAFHSPLVADACVPFEAFLGDVAFVPASVPVFHNRTAAIYPADPAKARQSLARQLAEPVRFAEQLRAMHGAGARVFVEVGPGTVLTGLVRQTLGAEATAIALNPAGVPADVGLLQALARLAVRGAAIGWECLWDGYRSLPPAEKHSAATLPVGGYNLGRPYPARDGRKTPAVVTPLPATPSPSAAPVSPPRVLPPAIPSRAEPARSAVASSSPAPAAVSAVRGDRAASSSINPSAEISALSSVKSLPASSRDAVAHAHETFLRAMADAHRTFLAAMTGGALPPSAAPDLTAVVPAAVSAPVRETPAAVPTALQTAAPVQASAMPAPRSAAAPARTAVAVPSLAPAPAPSHRAPLAPVSASSAAPTLAAADVIEVVMKTVADKTGYPREMLKASMQLEGDLGIDSIKRVEILSAVQKQLPGLPAVDAKAMGTLQTLEAISDYLASQLGAAVVNVPPAPVAAPAANSVPSTSPTSSVAATADVIEVVMRTVAEKTGYPRDMLVPTMQLEGDLGIDSIKRVEILSAVQKQLPGLPAVDAKVMGSLQTLEAVANHLIERLGGSAPAAQVATARLVQIAVDAMDQNAAETLPVRRYRLRAETARASGLATPGLHAAKRVVITDDGGGVAPALAAELSALGVTADVVTGVPADAEAVILLDGLRGSADSDAVLHSAFATLRTIAPAFTQRGGVLVTVQATGGTFGLEGPVTAPGTGGLAGLAKTAAKEWPLATVRVIDLERDRAANLAARLARELQGGGDELEIGVRTNGLRVRPVLVADAGASAITPRISSRSVVLATGGARGVTAATLIALARAHRPKFALLGRTELKPEPEAYRGAITEAELRAAALAVEKAAGRTPTPKALGAIVSDLLAQREIRATLAAIQAAGSAAEYFSADTTAPAAIAQAVQQARSSLGPITTLVHGAGVLADKLIADKAPEQFARVLATKVAGLRALLAATRDEPVDAMILFSSVAGRFGNRGQADYAAANEVLNKMAHEEFERRGGKCLVRSINWGPWEGGMVTPELRGHFAQQGIGVIPRETGATALVHELGGEPDRAGIEITIGAGRLDLGSSERPDPIRRGELRVSAARFPCLNSHVVKGRPVVPIALAAEWLLAAAQLAHPSMPVRGLRDIQVLKPIALGSGGDEVVLVLATRQLDEARVEVTLTAARGDLPFYRATADFGPAVELRLPPATRPTGWQAFAYDAAGVYDGRMFHGPDFQVVTALGGWSATAAELTIKSLDAAGAGWRVGPALLDGALQAATLWLLEARGKSSLPMRVTELIVGRTVGAGEICTCRVRGSLTELAGVADVDCLDAQGALVFALRGVECFPIDSYWTTVKA